MITRDNFPVAFDSWKQNFAIDKDPQESVLAFILDLQGKGTTESDHVVFRIMSDGEPSEILKIPLEEHTKFWDEYRRPSHSEMVAIVERKDRLVVMQLRRTTGEFFTPLKYASLAHKYLADSIPDRYEGKGNHHSMYDDFNWWDPCCGTGNLTIDCPPMMQGNLFMSTLNQEDIDVIKNSGQNPNAEIFQYDFLNQDHKELPKKLRKALMNEKPWIFILNPPYAMDSNTKAIHGTLGKTSSKIAKTAVGERMNKTKMDQASKNPMSQFVFRITEMTERYDLNSYMGIFSKAVIWNGMGSERLRWYFRLLFKPVNGFCFHASKFQGTAGNWPVVYSVWEPGASTKHVVVDILGDSDVPIGRKIFRPSKDPLTKWVPRPKNTETRPAMNGALGIVERNTVNLDRMAPGGLGFILFPGNSVQHGESVLYIVSGPHENGMGWTITPDNFHDSMVSYAARKLTIQTWLNDRDEFSVPNVEHPAYHWWAKDAIIWSLLHRSNMTSSLGNVPYKGEIYDIPNHFFWMSPSEMEDILGVEISDSPRFVSSWLKENEDQFSDDALEVLALGRELVRVSAHMREMASPKFHLNRWDAGFYQVRMGLFEKKNVSFEIPLEMTAAMERFREAHRSLGDRLRPMIYELGFLPY